MSEHKTFILSIMIFAFCLWGESPARAAQSSLQAEESTVPEAPSLLQNSEFPPVFDPSQATEPSEFSKNLKTTKLRKATLNKRQDISNINVVGDLYFNFTYAQLLKKSGLYKHILENK
ncbi:MAG: hypothetical protein LBB29_03660 [Holosporaceae bacterium]|jgi:hypothetical protein|nr:hypothetical protein [Holosporaceae bacterium]